MDNYASELNDLRQVHEALVRKSRTDLEEFEGELKKLIKKK